jgi:RNA polymerase sigma-70 factor (ECF subfamily)
MTVNLNALEVHLLNSSADSVPVVAGVRASAQLGELTRRMAAGDEAAFREFYDAYSGRLWRYLLVMTAGNEDSAREALQATLIRVARHIKTFHDEAVFWSWLTVLARSAYCDDTRKHRRYFSFLDRFTRHADVVESKSDGENADEQLSASLERHIAALTPEEQKLIEQKYFARRSVRDLAAEFQTTEKAIESRLSRIRHKLKSAVLAGLNHEP